MSIRNAEDAKAATAILQKFSSQGYDSVDMSEAIIMRNELQAKGIRAVIQKDDPTPNLRFALHSRDVLADGTLGPWKLVTTADVSSDLDAEMFALARAGDEAQYLYGKIPPSRCQNTAKIVGYVTALSDGSPQD